MRVSQLLHAMYKDDEIVIEDFDAPVNKAIIYNGSVRGIKRDNPVNKMHIKCVCAKNDTTFVLAAKQRERR